jgi:hypothetical protein
MDASDITGKMDRRTALKLMALGAAGLGLGSATRGWAAAPATAAMPARAATAKAVIQIWMWGGPPHTDTFDPKPDAGNDYSGPLNKPIPTNVSGIMIGELLPLLAQQADKYSIIRSMTHGNNGHETAAYITQTGRQPGSNFVCPGVGSVVSLFKGYDHGYSGLIPPYVVLTQLQGRFSEAGFLGPAYKPFATGGNPAAARFEVDGIIAPGMTDERQKARRELLVSLDSLGHAMPTHAGFQRFDETKEKAYDLILGDSRKLFDLSQESQALRDAYGRNTFGQSCLMARRLVETGVPYITINYGGWDTHKQNFEAMRRKLPEMDRALAALLTDLADKKLLDSTIVWCGGEFGRTPKVDWQPPWNGGRGHHGACFTHVVAGGGFKGGQVVGASDAKGEKVAQRPVSPTDLIGSVYTLMGIDCNGPLPNPRGQDIRVLASSKDEGFNSGGLLKEIM